MIVAIYFVLGFTLSAGHPPQLPSIPVAHSGVNQPGEGARIYAQTCSACHQADGSGTPGIFPPLVGTEWVTGSEDRLIRILLHGVTGDIEVEGEIYNGAMPTWGPMFTDEDLAAVATYVRQAWGNKAAPVTAATVARVRTQYASRTTPWTAVELRQTTKPPAR